MLVSYEERIEDKVSYKFGTTWKRVNDDRIFFFFFFRERFVLAGLRSKFSFYFPLFFWFPPKVTKPLRARVGGCKLLLLQVCMPIEVWKRLPLDLVCLLYFIFTQLAKKRAWDGRGSGPLLEILWKSDTRGNWNWWLDNWSCLSRMAWYCLRILWHVM